MVEEIDTQDESTHKNTGDTDEEVQDTCPAFDDDLDCRYNPYASHRHVMT
jgi:hypothetical protein